MWDWAAIGAELTADLERHAPAAIGINLVELTDPTADAVALVTRAAEVLASIG